MSFLFLKGLLRFVLNLGNFVFYVIVLLTIEVKLKSSEGLTSMKKRG